MLTAVAAAYPDVQHYEGYAYSVSDGKLLYRESHWRYTEGGAEQQLIVYRCADGAPFARKRVDMVPGAAIPDFEMLDARNGYRDGVRTRQGRREVFEQADAQAPERRAPLTVPPNAVVDAGLHAFVRAHWDLLSGTGVSPLPILVPGRLGYIDFSARRLGDTSVDGNDMRWFRLSLANWLGFALPHIEVAYDTRTHELREYRGLTDISGNGHRNLNVRIHFPPAEWRLDTPLADVQAAAVMPLPGRCLIP